jgi:hypothetical protein
MSAAGTPAAGAGTRPQVAAVLGPHTGDDVRRLARAAGLPADPWLTVDDRVTVLVDDAAPPTARSRVAWTLRGLAADASPLPGVAAWAGRDGERVVLRGDEAGLLPLLYRRVGERLFVASSIEALVAVADAPLHVDWRAWGDLLQLGYPIGGRTPFEEIRRLEPTEELLADGGAPRVVARPWRWAEVDAGALATDEAAARVVERLRATFDAVEGPLTVPLSGGQDSRLLLATAPRDRLVETVTIDTDAGTGSDQQLAAAVAAAFEVPHRRVPPDHQRRYEDDAAEVADVVEHQTSLHPWFLTLVRALDEPGTVVDGLAGMLMKGNFVPQERDDDPDPSAARWRVLAPARDLTGIVRPEAAGWWRRTSGEAVEAVHDRFRDHPAGVNLVAYTTRTMRGVALSPVHLLASRHPTAVPFADTELAATALAVEPGDRESGAFYRAVLARADRRAAALPTSADVADRLPVAARRELQPSAQAWYRDLLLDERLRPLLDPAFVLRVAGGRTPGLFLHRPERYAVRGLALLARWLDRHADVLADVDPPSELRTPPRPWADAGPAPWRDPWLEDVEASVDPGRTLRLWWEGRLRGEQVEGGAVTTSASEVDVAALAPGSLDLVVLDDVLRHVDEPLALEAALRDALASDATVAVSSAWPFGDDRPLPEDVVAAVGRVARPTTVSLGRGRVRVVGNVDRGDERGGTVAEVSALLAARRTDDLRHERRAREREVAALERTVAERDAALVAGGEQLATLADELKASRADVVRARRWGDGLQEEVTRLRSGTWWRLGELLRAARRRPALLVRLPRDVVRLLRER